MKTSLIVIILFCLAFLMLDSCTVIGFTVGAVHDSNYDREESGEIFDFATLDLEDEDCITVNLRNGNSVSGLYLGKDTMNENLYHQKYGQFKAKSNLNTYLPNIGEQVLITTKNGREIERIFVGFEQQGLLLKEKGRTKRQFWFYENLDSVKFSGTNLNRASGQLISTFIKKYSFPVYTGITLNIAGQNSTIPINRIESIELPARNSYAAGFWGTLIGLGIDALLISNFDSHSQ